VAAIAGDPDTSTTPRAGRRWVRVLLTAVVLVFAVFWIWALFFASKEAVNRIGDRAWAARAEQICVAATEARLALTDPTPIEAAGPDAIPRRAAIVDDATDILERMLDDVVAVPPDDEKGQAIVPLWEDEYRVYIADRRQYAEQLRDSGENLPFYETAEGGVPVTERLATFAGDNDMATCAPPIDLTR
jgi:hypothetical protein